MGRGRRNHGHLAGILIRVEKIVEINILFSWRHKVIGTSRPTRDESISPEIGIGIHRAIQRQSARYHELTAICVSRNARGQVDHGNIAISVRILQNVRRRLGCI